MGGGEGVVVGETYVSSKYLRAPATGKFARGLGYSEKHPNFHQRVFHEVVIISDNCSQLAGKEESHSI